MACKLKTGSGHNNLFFSFLGKVMFLQEKRNTLNQERGFQYILNYLFKPNVCQKLTDLDKTPYRIDKMAKPEQREKKTKKSFL